MDQSESCITVFDRIHHNTHGKQIINLIQRLILVDHLPVNTEKVFDTAVNLRFNASGFHMMADFIHNRTDKGFPLAFFEAILWADYSKHPAPDTAAPGHPAQS